jgi:hypothetical protein
MAFGFVKKIFSFGKKAVEEKPVEEAEAQPLETEAAAVGPQRTLQPPQAANRTFRRRRPSSRNRLSLPRNRPPVRRRKRRRR